MKVLVSQCWCCAIKYIRTGSVFALLCLTWPGVPQLMFCGCKAVKRSHDLPHVFRTLGAFAPNPGQQPQESTRSVSETHPPSRRKTHVLMMICSDEIIYLFFLKINLCFSGSCCCSVEDHHCVGSRYIIGMKEKLVQLYLFSSSAD